VRIIKWIVGISLGLLFSTILIAGFVFTPWGTKLAIKGADAWLDELTIDYRSGGLGSELLLNKVQWQQANVQATSQDIQLNIDWSCTWSMNVCINTLKTGAINVQLSVQADDSAPASSDTPLTLPFNLRVDSLKIGSLNVLIKDQLKLSWQSVSSRFSFEKSLDVASLEVVSLQVDVLSNEVATQPAEPFDWTKWQYQGITQLPVSLPLAFNLTEVNIAPFKMSTNGQQTLLLTSLGLSAGADAKTLSLRQLTIRHQLAEVSASAEVGLDGNLQHQLNVKAQYFEPQGGEIKMVLSSKGNLQQLETQAHISGLIQADVDLAAELASNTLPLDITVSWQNLTWPLVKQVGLPAQFESLQGKLHIEGNLDGLKLVGQGDLAGQGLPVTSFNLQANADRQKLLLDALRVNTLGGQIIAKGAVTFSDYLEIVSSLELSHINPGVLLPEYQADINGQLHAEVSKPSGQWRAKLSQLNINGIWRDFPLSIGGNAQIDDLANVVLNKFSIKNGENSLVLDGKLSSDRIIDFTLQLDAPALEQSVADLQGRLSASAHISGTLEQPALKYTLEGEKLSFADINVEAFDGKGQVLWDELKPVSIELNVQQVIGVNNQIDELKFSLTGNAQAHELLLDTTSNKTNLLARIQGTLANDSWQGRWLEGQIESTYASLTLAEPFTISANWLLQEYAISPHCWQQVNSDLCIKQASFSDNRARWDLALHELNLIPLLQRVVPSFPPIDSTSKLSMTLKGDWLLSELPSAQLHASLSPATWRFKDKKTLQLDIKEFNLDGQISEQNVSVSMALSGPQIGLLALNLQGEAGNFNDQLDRPVTGELSLSNINLAPFRVFLPQLDKFEGKLAGNTQITGTLLEPLVNGVITLSEGAVQGQDIPLIISGVNQTLELKGDKASLNGSYLLGKGKGSIVGELAWRPQLTGKINVAGQNLELDYQSMLRAQVSPNIDIQFSPNAVKVKGEVVVPYARFKLRTLPQGTVSPSKDVVLVEQQAELAQTEQLLDLNIVVSVDPMQRNDVKLDAFGLTTDLRGNMRLENSKLGMIANGDVQLINGRYRAYGQNLIIREGDITFNGSLDRPFLNIEAVRDPKLTADDVVAGIRVDGAADSPKVEVFSEPVMEQQQSLSYMLTGRGLGQSSGDSQETVLANMLLGFGLGQSENMVTNIGQKLGFKDVNLDTSGQGENTQLSVSGYVAPGVQLRYGVGVFNTASEVAIRYELLPQLYIEAVSGLSNALDIYYSFSIEGSQNKKILNKDNTE
jgi:translocation and assembly module TamB